MTKRQEYLLQLFREVDEICRNNNLKYVMAGGSLIGVVRHEGFIPWDDDMDLYMTRDDWDKFVKICEKELPETRTIQCVEADRKCSNTIGRYVSTETCVIHKNQIIDTDCAGEVIDVLTLDPIPADDKEYESYLQHLMIYSEIVNSSTIYGHRFEVPVGKYLRYQLSYYFLGKDRTLRKLEKKLYSYKEEECNRYAMRWGGCPFLFDKDMMFPVKYGNFEGDQVMLPNRCSDYLTWHYGDEWSYMPPHAEQEGHITITVDGISYEEFREDYMPGINKFKVKFQAVVRKYYAMANAKKAHKIYQETNQLKAKSIEMDLKERFSEEHHSLKELLKQRNFHELNKLFAVYYQTQLSARFIGREDFLNIYAFFHPTLIALEDEVFQAAMVTLFYTERIGKAWRMLRVREKLDHLSLEMQSLDGDIAEFRKAATEYEFGRVKEAEEMIDELLEKWPDHPGLMKFKCRFFEQYREDQLGEVEQFLQHALSLFPEDGYFMKYQADLMWRKGQKRAALQLYAQVREHTNNGVVLLEMERFLKTMKRDAIRTADQLLGEKRKQEAAELMALWYKLLPEEIEIQGMYDLTQIELVKTQSELEALLNPIFAKAEKVAGKGIENKSEKGIQIYERVLARAWNRLGYSTDLAACRGKLVFTEDDGELEWLAEEIRGHQIQKDVRGQVFKLIGDVRKKQGQTKQAFENYQRALQYKKPSYVKTELARIILEDLDTGSKKTAMYAKKADVSQFIDSWLDKYGSLEEIQALAQKIV